MFNLGCGVPCKPNQALEMHETGDAVAFQGLSLAGRYAKVVADVEEVHQAGGKYR
jgi:hypothetical protein